MIHPVENDRAGTVRNLWRLLSPAQRRGAFVMLALMLVGMVLETIGVGLVIPAIALMSQGDVATKFPRLAPVLAWLGNPTQARLMAGAMILLVVGFAIKTAYLSYLVWRQARYASEVQIELSHRLFSAYMRQPYTFHLQRNSAELNRNVSSEVSLFASSIASAMVILTELLVVVGILGLLLAVEPVGALLVFAVLSLAGWAYHAMVRTRLLRWGEARQRHEGLRIQHLLQAFSAVKDLKVLGREDEFLGQFQRHNTGSSIVNRRQVTLQQYPRLWLELIAVIALATVVLVMIAQGDAPSAIVPTLGVFAAAAFRVLPSANRVLGSVQNVRYAVPVVEVLTHEFRVLAPTEPSRRGPRLPFMSQLSLSHVSFRYPGAHVMALSDVSIEVSHGSTVGLIGTTGAGKSTLVDIILGLLAPTEGVVRVDGKDIQAHLRGWQDQIGYVPQSIYLTDDTLARNVAFGIPSEMIDETAVWRALAAAQMADFVRQLPNGLHTEVGERGVRLSGGQRQRIGIARALYNDPAVLMLDEATSSLDTSTERDVMSAISSLHGQKTIIIVAHRLSTVGNCDRLYRLERGKVVQQGDAHTLLSPAAAAG